MKIIPKYKRVANNIYSFLQHLCKPMSRVEILNKFREDKLYHKGSNTIDRALVYLVENEKIKKYYSKSGRIMFVVQHLNRTENENH